MDLKDEEENDQPPRLFRTWKRLYTVLLLYWLLLLVLMGLGTWLVKAA